MKSGVLLACLIVIIEIILGVVTSNALEEFKTEGGKIAVVITFFLASVASLFILYK